jgi:hypothetical protein
MKDKATRLRLQIDTSKEVRDYAKAYAYQNGLSLNEFVLLAISDSGDSKLKKLVQDDIGKDKTLPKK